MPVGLFRYSVFALILGIFTGKDIDKEKGSNYTNLVCGKRHILFVCTETF